MPRSAFLLTVLAVFLMQHLSAQSLFDSIRVARSAEVYFAFGEAALPAEAQTELDSLVLFFNNTPDAAGIRITAHTDSVGNFENNMALSRRRAQSVSKGLVSRGIAPKYILTACFGEKRPAAANQTEEGRQRNRHALVEVLLRIPMAQMTGRVVDQKTGQGIQATLVFTHKTLSDSTHTDTAGRYSVRVPSDMPIKVDAYAQGYFFDGVLRRAQGSNALADKAAKDKGEIRLQPALPGETIVLKNLFFVGNSPDLLESSKPTLPKILKFMQLNPDLKVEIAGHVNVPFAEKGKEIYTMKNTSTWELSENRAKTVYNYLIDNGIASEHLSWKGYGNSQMVKPYARSEADAALNRRVEIRILGETTLSDRK